MHSTIPARPKISQLHPSYVFDFVWDLSSGFVLWDFRLDPFVRVLSFGIFRVGPFVSDRSLGAIRVGRCA